MQLLTFRRDLGRRGAVALSLALTAAVVSAAPVGAVDSAAFTPGLTIGASATAGLYAWGVATMPDGSVLVGDYWNYRIQHFNANGTPFSSKPTFAGKFGFGPGTNQAPFGICVDTTAGSPTFGDVFMTEGSLYDVNMYDSSGNWLTNWGSNQAVNQVPFTYPSQCAVSPVTHLLYISNQWAKSIVILDPAHPATPAQFVSPPAPNTFIQPRGLAFDASGRMFLADEGHKRIDIYNSGTPLTNKPDKTIVAPPESGATTFDMRGLALDTSTGTSPAQLLFVTNGQNCLVQEFNADPLGGSNYGKFILNFNGVTPPSGSNCGTGSGQFEDGARGLAVDSNHDVWVGDLGSFRAQRFDESGNPLSVVPTPPAPPPTGGFNGPRGDTFDASGNLYVTDMFNERIEEFAPPLVAGGAYTFSKAWGARGDTASTFNYPRLLCFDPVNGYIIVANTDSNEIVAWDASTASPHEKWFLAGLNSPYGVTCAADGTIYVANGNSKDVVKVDSTGLQTGTIGTTSNLGFVRGIWADTDGSIWVDAGATAKVFHFQPDGSLLGQFTTPAGSNPFGIAGDAGYLYIAFSSINEVGQYTRGGTLVGTFGGPGTKVGKMRTPQGLAFGLDGNLYVVEENTNRVSIWAVP